MRKILLLLACAAFLAPSFAQEKEEKPYKAYMVANAHFDTHWNWTVQKSIREYLRNTLTQNIWLIENYPNYIFNFEGGVKYSWMKEYYPELFEKVKEYVKAGRWHVAGSSWDANDFNMPSPESGFRNILLGQEFYKQEFGVQSYDIMLPDCFGFSYTLPTIAAHSGLLGFATQKLAWRTATFHGDKKIPFPIGLWEGVDGAQIMMAIEPGAYGTQWECEDLSNNAAIINNAKASYNNTAFRYYGTGDIGGSCPAGTARSLEMGVAGDGPVEIMSSAADQIFRDYAPFSNHPDMPVYKGELLMDLHATGCYTAQSVMKLFNRRNETLADAAERSSVISDWYGGVEYPRHTFDEAWKRFIWHQFHDDLTGTSIPEVYTTSWNDELLSQTQFMSILNNSSRSIISTLDTKTKGVPVVIYNPMVSSREEIIEMVIDSPVEPKGGYAISPDKKSTPVQIKSYKDGKATILFSAKLNPLSYSVYDVCFTNSAKRSPLKASKTGMENSVYRLKLDENGDIASIYDKVNRRELVEEGKAFRLALIDDNNSYVWPAWEIHMKSIEREPLAIVDPNMKVEVEECGATRAVLRVERSFKGSKYIQRIIMTDGGVDDRIDIQTEIDWEDYNSLLKVEFPMAVSNEMATYDLGIGSIERGVNATTETRGTNDSPLYEVYAQQWADITDAKGDYGVAILNDCKYGWDKPSNNLLRLTLFHTPKAGNYEYQSKLDHGNHSVTYSIVGHKSNYKNADIVWKAEELNNPVISYVAQKHSGVNGKSISFVESSSDQVIVKALKKAEHEEAYVVRLFENQGKAANNVEISFPANIVEAKVLNAIEEVQGDAKFKGNKLIIDATPFSPMTFSVKLAPSDIKLAKTESTHIELPFDNKAFSNDHIRMYLNYDGKGRTYAYELIPRVLDYKGVTFKMGGIESYNALRCEGDTIALPQDKAYNKVYLLASSAVDDRRATFTIGDNSVEKNVPYFSGFLGQWGHTGFSEGYFKDVEPAYIGTHTHSIQNGNEPYEFGYMFLIELNVPEGATEVILPVDKNISIFAATAAVVSGSDVTLGREIRTIPKITKEIEYVEYVEEEK